ncbi:MAG: DNA alkylation repair protein [Planctomycetota bacterium]
MKSADVEKALRANVNAEKAAFYPRFFRTGPGEYGEGDRFLGVIIPHQRKIARQFKELPGKETLKLLRSKWHECRMTALLILVIQYEKAKTDERRKEIYQLFMSNLDFVNNWDLVDSSCHKIAGPWLFERSRKPLYKLASTDHLWRNRIAVVTTYYFIKRGDFADTLSFAEQLLEHPHDLIHKAVGWMLREVGKQDEKILCAFLEHHAASMPRTMLRYSLEKLDATKRERYMSAGPKRVARKHK